MSCIRPATPGFLVTLTATVLLALVSFSTPWLKSIYFLKATLSSSDFDGSVNFGTLGYCLTLSNGTTCSKASVGYELDINELVGNTTSIEIPEVVVKWITYALVLHIVGLVLAAISAIFGLFAHIRECATTCCSSLVSGLASSVTFLAFVFDLALFFIAKSRINSVDGASARIGNGVWLTLAAWLCLTFAGCFYCFGRCCIRRRSHNDRGLDGKPNAYDPYGDQMRLDAVKAEADRKARQKQGEVGLPAFNEYEQQPLTGGPEVAYEDNNPYRPGHSGNPGHTPGGYAQAPAGTRAIDDLYNTPASQGVNSYPPQPTRQGSAHTQTTSGYAGSVYAPTPVVPAAAGATAAYLATSQSGHQQYPTNASQNYGYAADSAAYPTQQAYADPYNSRVAESSFNADTYNSSGYMPSAAAAAANTTSYDAFYSQAAYTPAQPQRQPSYPDRSYTLGGGGYGGNTVPNFNSQAAVHSSSPSPVHVNTNVAAAPTRMLSPSGPRAPNTYMSSPMEEEQQYEDSPPVYDAIPSQPQPSGGWDAKR